MSNKAVSSNGGNNSNNKVTLREFLVSQCVIAKQNHDNLKAIVKKSCKEREQMSYFKGIFIMGTAVLKFLDEVEKVAKEKKEVENIKQSKE